MATIFGRETNLRGAAGVGVPLLSCLLLTGFATSCLKNVSGDLETGKDGKVKGAKKLRIEEYQKKKATRIRAEGRSRDVVTYPGGDRIDWWVFEVPKSRGGRLDIRMKVRAPRRGLDLAMNVYDPFRKRVARVRRSPKTRTKKVRIKGAQPGKYYLQVYAPKRMDAGKYQLYVDYREAKEQVVVVTTDGIPDPPALPAIPEVEVECQKDVDCAQEQICRQNKCVKKAGPCDKCTASQTCEADKCIDVKVTPCVTARVAKFVRASNGSLIITLDRGANNGVARQWTGSVLRKGSKKPLNGGNFTVTRATQKESVAKVRLSVDQIRANGKARMCPP